VKRFLPVIGRVLFSLIFLVAAPRHFTSEGIGHAAELGVPFASIVVPLSGLLAIVGALSVAIGYKARWGAWALVAFLVPVTLGMHAFWQYGDSEMAHIQQAMFAKNISMLGGALIIAFFGAGPIAVSDESEARS